MNFIKYFTKFVYRNTTFTELIISRSVFGMTVINTSSFVYLNILSKIKKMDDKEKEAFDVFYKKNKDSSLSILYGVVFHSVFKDKHLLYNYLSAQHISEKTSFDDNSFKILNALFKLLKNDPDFQRKLLTNTLSVFIQAQNMSFIKYIIQRAVSLNQKELIEYSSFLLAAMSITNSFDITLINMIYDCDPSLFNGHSKEDLLSICQSSKLLGMDMMELLNKKTNFNLDSFDLQVL